MPAVSPTPATLPKPRPAPTDISTPIEKWLSSFSKYLENPDLESASSLFLADAFWRDHLCLSWDFKTKETPSKIHELLSSGRITSITLRNSPAVAVGAIDFAGEVPAIVAFVDIKTTVGHGQGVVKLLEDLDGEGKGVWKAYTVFTALKGLDKFPEGVGKNRPHGVTHGADKLRRNWKEQRADEVEFVNSQPVVLIIGAGQSGLVAAARLKMIGIPTLIIDKHERVGDNWRKRYHQLVIHDPVNYDHLPYLNFPACWPKFTPKDKFGDWLESYASVLELNVWVSSTISASSWDSKTKAWNVTVNRPSGSRELQPRHLILATGHSGEPNMPLFSGMDTFKGDVLCHSSAFPGAKKEGGDKRKAVVVGCCNSGHDIAQDYYEKGYDVTIVQRSSTYVMTSENGLDVLLKNLYDEDGPADVEEADMIFMAFPIRVFKRNQISATQEIGKRDKHINDALVAAGFNLDKGPDSSGFFMKYLERGGGYYLDVGASALISAGAIKLKQGHDITKILPSGVEFDDGSTLAADEIVFATGYGSMVTTAEKILGADAVQGLEDVWGIDEDTGEIRGMWKKAGDKNLYFMGGNLALVRWFSRGLALGIAASEGALV